jgi:hypothetical protein
VGTPIGVLWKHEKMEVKPFMRIINEVEDIQPLIQLMKDHEKPT